MTKPPGERRRNPRLAALLAAALLTTGGLLATGGCRGGNLRSAFAVATGRVDLEGLEAAAAQREQLARREGPTPPAVSQASFSPNASLGAMQAYGDAAPPVATSAALFSSVDPATGNPKPTPSRDEAMAAILPQLQRLGATNPAAQQRLLSQLQTSNPAHWPLLVRRLEADLAVHQQLNASPLGAGSPVTPAAHHQPSPTPATLPATPTLPATAPTSTPWPANPWPANPAGAESLPPAPPSRMPPTTTQAWRQPPAADPAIRLASAELPMGAPPSSPALSSPAPLAPAGGFSHAAPLEWRVALEQAISRLGDAAPSYPQSADEAYQHARLRLLQLAAGDRDGAATAIPGLSSTEQSYWSHQLYALSAMMDDHAQPETKRRAAAANLHLTNAASQLDQLSSLSVRNLTFCREVYGFGAYDPVAEPDFQPGDRLKLYAEVRHYKSVATEDGEHTSLAASYRLLDANGRAVANGDSVVEDYCLSRRRDFHIAYTIPVPESLAAGEYRLELTIEDQIGNKRGYGSLGFRVASGPGATRLDSER